MNIKDINTYIETLALSFTIADETMPNTSKEFRKDLVRFAKEVVVMLDQERYDQGFHDGANKTAIELSNGTN